MANEKLELKDENFPHLKGKVQSVDKKSKSMVAGLDLNDTFENPPKPVAEIELQVEEDTVLSKIEIEVQGTRVVEEGEKEDADFDDFEKGSSLLIIPPIDDDVTNILSTKITKAREVIIFTKK